jgi:hypothetical protein
LLFIIWKCYKIKITYDDQHKNLIRPKFPIALKTQFQSSSVWTLSTLIPKDWHALL